MSTIQQSKRRRPRMPDIERMAAAEWRQDVMRRARYRCECCNRRAHQAHHVIKQQDLHRRGLWCWDARVGMALCETCHRRHHAHSKPIPLIELRADTLDYAFARLGPYAFDYLRRYYGGPDPRLDSRLVNASN